MASPDDLLDALDPEQRQVAEALRGPGPGARRRRHRQDPRDHPPDRLRRRHRRLRADRGAGRHLHHPGRRRDAGTAAHARRRRASRPAPSTRPRCASCATSGRTCYGAELPTLIESKIGAARRAPPAASGSAPTRRLLRDLASEIEWAKVSNVHPDDYAARRAARGRSVTGHDHDTVARVFSSYEEVKRAQGRMDMEDVLLLDRRPARRGRAGRRPGPPAVQVVRRRRVPGRLARSSRRCSTCGSAAATSSAWSATRPRRSTPSPAPTPPTCATSRSKFPGTTSHRAGPQLPLHAPRSSRPPTRLLAGLEQPRACELRAQRAVRPGGHLHAEPRRGRRGRGGRRADPRAARRGAAAWARSRCCSASTRSPRPTRTPSSARGIPYVVRGAARFFDRAGGARGRHPAARRRPVGGGRRVPRDRARHAVRHGLDQPGARPRAARPATAGSPGRRWSTRPTEFARTPGADPRRLRRRPRPPGHRAARPGRRRRHAGHLPRRQGPGVGLGLPRAGCRTARCRSPTPTPRPRSRRSAGCSTSA